MTEEYDENEIQPTDVVLEITTWAGLSIGAVHFYGKLVTWEMEPMTLMTTLTREQANVLNKRHGCKPGDLGEYREGQQYNGFDDVQSIIDKALDEWQEHFPEAQRLVYGRVVMVEHDGVLATK